MQAFGLVVVDLDGERISTLASQLTEQGYSVASAAVSASDPPATSPVIEDAAAAGAAADTLTDPAPPPSTGHDNSQPFKCPACGKTFDVEVVCENQHEPVQTLATEDVLAGAEPSAPETAAPAESPETVESGEAAVESPAGPSGAATPAEPATPGTAEEAAPPPSGGPGWPA